MSPSTDIRICHVGVCDLGYGRIIHAKHVTSESALRPRDEGRFVSKQNPMSTWSVAPAGNANAGLINVPRGTGERGVMGSSRSHKPWNPGG